MEQLLYTCIGFSLGVATVVIASAVGQRLREADKGKSIDVLFDEWEEVLESKKRNLR